MTRPRHLLQSLFEAAVASASPTVCMPAWLPSRPHGRIVVIGAGKAAASMAAVLEQQWGEPLEGLVIVPYGHGVQCASIAVVEAAHPIPDEAGVSASMMILDEVGGLTAQDTVICLLSGGGSSLLCIPESGVRLAEKQRINSQLLRSGAAIHEINTVRKKISAIKGGKLAAAAAPARVITLLISDVPGNDPAIIASGPTIHDMTTSATALEILARYRIKISPETRRTIENSQTKPIDESDVRILATSDDALLAAAALSVGNDLIPLSLGDLSGDARVLAAEHAELALKIIGGKGPVQAPCILLSGGETTVEINGNGRGGRNGEYALALAITLAGHPSIHAIACDTDGIDGSADNAGCYVAPDSLQRAIDAGVDPIQAQTNNNSYAVFEATDGLIMTGPTRTNVNDFRAILIEGPNQSV